MHLVCQNRILALSLVCPILLLLVLLVCCVFFICVLHEWRINILDLIIRKPRQICKSPIACTGS